ncbi:MAG: dihydroorotase, partial [Candidatus Omnitrophica bacterium]|nr:dihydroorotase [Candidatus Omnitrophota bacterium]
IDPDREWIPREGDFASQSKNSCFLGKKLFGVVEVTLVSGKIAYQNRD